MPHIDGLVMHHPNLIEAMHRLELVPRDTPVLETLTEESVRGKVLLGSVPAFLARHARTVAEPVIRIGQHERSTRLSVEEILSRFAGLSWFRVEDLGPPTELAEVITSNHAELNAFVRQEELARPDALVCHRAQQKHVRGRHAIGMPPLRVAVAARLVTHVPVSLLRGLWVTRSATEEQRARMIERVFSYRVHASHEPAGAVHRQGRTR